MVVGIISFVIVVAIVENQFLRIPAAVVMVRDIMVLFRLNLADVLGVRVQVANLFQRNNLNELS